MKRYLALTLGAIGLGGCTQMNRAGELLLDPPLTVLEGCKAFLLWLANIAGGFLSSLVQSLFL